MGIYVYALALNEYDFQPYASDLDICIQLEIVVIRKMEMIIYMPIFVRVTSRTSLCARQCSARTARITASFYALRVSVFMHVCKCVDNIPYINQMAESNMQKWRVSIMT